MIYLDHAATTPVHYLVAKEMIPFFERLYGNPSSIYEFGTDGREMIERSRRIISKSLGANNDEIFFTSGGTESDNWAIFGIAKLLRKNGNHIITTKIEHHGVLNCCKILEKEGYDITYLSVNEMGEIDISELENSITDKTILISIMYANNEIGTIEPIEKIGEIAKKYNIIFHTDAVQAYMHEDIDVKKMGIDLLSASAHKFQGPKGTGFLYCNEEIQLPPLIYGGGQERGRRSGTENVPGIVGMGKAVSIGINYKNTYRNKIETMQSYVVREILQHIPKSHMNGSFLHRLPGNINVSFSGIESESLIILLDMDGICVSAGSACTARDMESSHVLEAIGLSEEYIRGSIRITLGPENTMEEMKYFLHHLQKNIANLRKGL